MTLTSEEKKSLTTKQELGYAGIGILIGIAYTVLFAVFSGFKGGW